MVCAIQVVAGSGDLNTTDLEGNYARSHGVYKHHQYLYRAFNGASEERKKAEVAERRCFNGTANTRAGVRNVHGSNTEPARDNFYSPAHPNVYIELRLMPAQHFYQQRIPQIVRLRFGMQVTERISRQ